MLTYNELNFSNAVGASHKARKVKPNVRIVDLGEFDVKSSQGDCYYRVTFHESPDGDTAFECECLAHTHGGRKCYHVGACESLYINQQAQALRVSERAAVLIAQVEEIIATEMAAQVHKCRDCNESAVTTEGRCNRCQAQKDREDIFG